MSWRRRWGEGSQNTAMLRFADWACGQGKLTFDPQVAHASPSERRPSSAARQLKVARPQPRSPAPRADPEGQFVI